MSSSRRNGSVSRAAETASKTRLHMDRNPQHSRITDPANPAGRRKELDNVMKRARQGSPGSWDRKLLEVEEKDPNRWRHTGYKQMYIDRSRSGSPRRSRSPALRKSRSPISRRSRSPAGLGRRSRSPVGLGRRSRSPFGLGRRSRSPVGLGRRSRSPIGLGRRSRSPVGLGRRSRSPVGLGRRSRSPVGRRSRSPKRSPRRSPARRSPRRRRSPPRAARAPARPAARPELRPATRLEPRPAARPEPRPAAPPARPKGPRVRPPSPPAPLPDHQSSGSGSSVSSCSDESCSVCSAKNKKGPPKPAAARSRSGSRGKRPPIPSAARAVQPTKELLKAREASKRTREEKVLEWQRSQLQVNRAPIPPAQIKREGERRRRGTDPRGGGVSPQTIAAALRGSGEDSDSEDSSEHQPQRISLSERFGKMAQWSLARSGRLEHMNMRITRRDQALHVHIQRPDHQPELPGELDPAPVGSYPEELLAVAPSGLPSWDDVQVRYDYYKRRGYLRGLTLGDYVKWEEWWYKYQEWLKRERAYERWAEGGVGGAGGGGGRRERRRRGGRHRRS